MSHVDNDHAVGTYLALTGHPHPRSRPLGIEPPASPLDMPSLGSVISKLRPPDAPVFPYVTLGVLRHLGNHDSMGQDAGCLGKVYDPFSVPEGARDAGGLRTLLGAAAGERLVRRRQLLGTIDRVPAALEATAATRSHDGFAQRAYELLASSASRQAFELAREPAAVRDAYGPSALGQNCLLARRLVEAGVPLVTVYSVANRDWDTHANNFKDLKEKLLPDTDRAVVGAPGRPGVSGTARGDAGRVDGRHGPHAADQRRGGAGPLVVLLLHRHGRWRGSRGTRSTAHRTAPRPIPPPTRSAPPTSSRRSITSWGSITGLRSTTSKVARS